MTTVREFFEQVFLPEVVGLKVKYRVRCRYKRAVKLLEQTHGDLPIEQLSDEVIDKLGADLRDQGTSQYMVKRNRQHLRYIARYAEAQGRIAPPVVLSPQDPTSANETKGPLKGLRRDRKAKQTIRSYQGTVTITDVDELLKLATAVARRNIRGIIRISCQLHVEVKDE
jgi:hypothetical protein